VREEIAVESVKEVMEGGREIEAVVRMAEVVPKKQREATRRSKVRQTSRLVSMPIGVIEQDSVILRSSLRI
jgi:hypothetical protein